MNIDDLIWVWIYTGIVVGFMTWFIILAVILHDLKNKDKK